MVAFTFTFNFLLRGVDKSVYKKKCRYRMVSNWSNERKIGSRYSKLLVKVNVYDKASHILIFALKILVH